MKYFKLGIILTRACNQKCNYCNNYKDIKPDNVDIDYLLYILDLYNIHGIDNMYIELSGGEPGLIPNIREVISALYNKDYIKKVDILSNGLIRSRYGGLFIDYPKLEGLEHTAMNIANININYFYNDITYFNNYFPNNKLLIVLDEITVNSLIENFEYFYKLKLFDSDKNIKFKIITPKLCNITNELINKYNTFYDLVRSKKILNYRNIAMDRKYLDRTCLIRIRDICAKISSMQFIDLTNNYIGQCSMNVETTNRAEITSDNIYKTIRGLLFMNKSEYCDKCIKYNENAYRYITDIKRHIYYNTETKATE